MLSQQPLTVLTPASELEADPASRRGADRVRDPAGILDSLFRAHAVSLVRLAVLLLGDQAGAEDVVQDAFLSLQRALPRIRDLARADAYLRTSVVNGCRSVQRSRHRAWLHGTQHDPPVWSAEAAALAGEETRAVLAAVATLPARSREILALRFYLDLPQQQIAETLGISRGTVSSTISRAIATLGRILQESQ